MRPPTGRDKGFCLVSCQVSDPAVEGGLTCAQFHPDGLILGTGTADALVRIWEVRQQKVRPAPAHLRATCHRKR